MLSDSKKENYSKIIQLIIVESRTNDIQYELIGHSIHFLIIAYTTQHTYLIVNHTLNSKSYQSLI